MVGPQSFRPTPRPASGLPEPRGRTNERRRGYQLARADRSRNLLTQDFRHPEAAAAGGFE